MLILAVTLLVCPVVALILLLFAKGETAAGIGIVLGCEAFILLLLAGLVFPVNYTIGEGVLRVRSGLLNWRIPLESIVEVTPTNNPLSAPALSLDRLKIRCRNQNQGKFIRSILISPENKTGFMQELARVVPGLQFDGERLVRK